MALAVKNTPETFTSQLLDGLSVGILVGVVYVLGSLAMVFKLIPGLWWSAFPEGFATIALLGAVELVTVVLLSAIGIWLLGSHPAHGLKAGIFLALAVLLVAILVAKGVAGLIEQLAFQGTIPYTLGMILAAAVAVALVVLGVGWVIRPKTHSLLMTIEDQGWFSVSAYKRSQGQMVRRGTIVALLGLIGCGIYVMIEHNTLGTASTNWGIDIPFTGTVAVKDPKDAAVLKDQLEQSKWVRVQSKGASNLPEGKVVPRSEFEAEKARVETERAKSEESDEKKKPQLPTGQPVLDRYDYREHIQDNLAKNYVKIEKPGDETSGFFAGEVVPKSKFNDVVKAMKDAGKKDDELPKAAKEPIPPEVNTEFASVTLLPNVKYTLPLFIFALGLWLSWRLVNMPVFADFLIATEAELNKVSWSTRRRLMQDTVVVLITVALLAVFILVMDTVWYKALSWRVIGVLQIHKEDKNEKRQEIPW
jgi:preprotein translocase SecE subunit